MAPGRGLDSSSFMSYQRSQRSRHHWGISSQSIKCGVMLPMHTRRKLNARPEKSLFSTKICAMESLKLNYWLSRLMTLQKLFSMLSQHMKYTSLLLVSLLKAPLLGSPRAVEHPQEFARVFQAFVQRMLSQKDDITDELEKLRLELRHIQEVYKLVQDESLEASQQMIHLTARHVKEEASLKRGTLEN